MITSPGPAAPPANPVGPESTDQTCAAWIARFLHARGIDRIFGLQGGHIQPIWDHEIGRAHV